MNSINIDHNILSNAINSHAIVAQTDINGVITFVNEKFCEVSGYTYPELIGKTHSVVNSGHHESSFFADMWRTIKAGETWQGEVCNRAKDGSLYWVSTTIYPERDRKGDIIGYISIRTEITKTKMDSVLLDAEQEAMHSIMVGDSLSVAMNKVLEKLHNFDYKNKLSILEALPPNHLNHLSSIGLPEFYTNAINKIEIMAETGSCSAAACSKKPVYVDDVDTHPYWANFRVVTHSANLVACWSHPVLDEDNNLYGTFAIYPADKRMPSELEAYMMKKTSTVLAVLFLFYKDRNRFKVQNTKMNNIIQSSPHCIFEMNLNGNVRSINKSGLAMLGLEKDDTVIGRFFPDIPNNQPERDEVNRLFQNALVGIPCEYEFRSDINGIEHHYWMCFAPLKDSNDNVYRILGISEDITIRKQNEKLLREKAMIAEEANTAKSNFLAAMSHELRTPLNAIIGFSEFLKMKYFGDRIGGKNEEYIDYIIESGQDMLKLVDEILDLTRVETGRIHLDEEEFNVNLFFSHLTNGLMQLASQKNIRLMYHPTNDVFYLKADKKVIGSIFKNIVGNAINHTPIGSIIDISFNSSEEGDLAIKISDQGPGFTAQSLKNLHQPFRSDDAYKTTKHKGAGLGLYLTKRYADLHSANVNISNREDIGADVEINFPAYRVKANRA
ncbi:PAS domain S-box protein [Pseudemcibacter aquimaris]|uniref:sensor histidine kinase n=1 Tax=Pseudemcibacter aquimaris TaxID=2857064 RepID=UPI002012EC33|nr:PAS domain S-box protein [Pseudemcibacter aquimaris]MCC3859608.1 PAS domain S-box protein [Pseudemcibacter aquimaris]WDU60003.1 PAS domain S-box protein [Pseudemcibacter aquimaris]